MKYYNAYYTDKQGERHHLHAGYNYATVRDIGARMMAIKLGQDEGEMCGAQFGIDEYVVKPGKCLSIGASA